MNELIEHSIEVNGVKTQFFSEGLGEPILFLPGFLGVWEGSKDRYPKLSTKFKIIGLNWPGVGKSEKLNQPHTIENYARFLLDFIAASGVSIHKIVASSIACLTTLRALELDPNAFTKVALISPTDDYHHLWYATLLLKFTNLIGRGVTIKIAQAIADNKILTGRLLKTVSPYSSADPQYVARYQRNAREKIALDVAYEVLNSVFSRKWTELYANSRIPSLMIVGEHDRIARLENTKRVASMNPNSKLIVLYGEDHHTHANDNTILRDSELFRFFSEVKG